MTRTRTSDQKVHGPCGSSIKRGSMIQSSGSRSESGTHAQKSVNSKSNLRHDNSWSRDGDDNESTDGGSDDGSDTQIREIEEEKKGMINKLQKIERLTATLHSLDSQPSNKHVYYAEDRIEAGQGAVIDRLKIKIRRRAVMWRLKIEKKKGKSKNLNAKAEGDAEFISQLPRGRLSMVLAREVCVDVRKVGEYQRMLCDLRRLSVLVAELRGLGDCGDGYESLRLLERLRLENVEKVIRLRLMMKETQLKITEKGKFIKKLRGSGGLGLCRASAVDTG
ncbi:hypothetical protein Tco_0663610 [Tanacetum coccineum]